MILTALLALLLGCSGSGGSDNENLADRPEDSIRDTLIIPRPELPALNNERKDTIFIYRKLTKDYYHAIYLDTSRQSKYYDRLTNFDFDQYDKQSYQDNYNHAKLKYPRSFTKRARINLAKNWLPVYRYKNEYCLYAPSDWGNAGRRIVNDSSFVFWDMEGPMPFPIQFGRQISRNKYSIQLLSPYNGDGKSIQITIHVIDAKTNLTLFEFFDEYDQSRYGLFVPTESAKNYNIIVNSSNQKQLEFDFDEIDYKKLLGNYEVGG